MHSLHLIADSVLTGGRPLEMVVKEAVAGGVDVVQLRQKTSPAEEVYLLARKILQVIKGPAARLVINDRVDIALALGADGVHLGQRSLKPRVVRKLTGPGTIIGVSTHNLAEAIEAEKEGADYITFSPVFSTQCKPGAIPKGLEALVEVNNAVGVPVVALGGINPENIELVVARGVTNAAVMSFILSAEDPREAAAQLKNELKK